MTESPRLPLPRKSGPPWWLRLLRDGAIVLIVVVALLAIAIFRQPSQGAMLYYQHGALANTWHRDEPAFTTTPILRALTVAAMENFGDDNDDPSLPESDDHCIPLPPHLVPPGGIGDPPSLAALNRYMGYLLPDGMQVLFCHALPSDAGQRLVILAVGPQRRGGGLLPPLACEAVIIEPSSWTGSPRQIGRQRAPMTDPWLAAGPATFLMGHAQGTQAVLPYSAAGHSAALRAHLLPGGRRLAIDAG